MAHMIDMTNGRANMAYVGETPWHGLGTTLEAGASIDTWTQAAGLNWEALKLPSFYPKPAADISVCGMGDMICAPDSFHIVRSDTYESMGVMSGRYQPVQPREVMEFFQNFILTDERFQLETAGSLKSGKVIWALAKFSEALEAGGDEHVPYALLTTSYNGSLATTAQATMIRVVCNNTLTASIFDPAAAAIKVPHSRAWTSAVQQDAHDRLAAVADGFDAYKSLADALRGAHMARHQTEALFKSLALPPHRPGQTEDSGKAKGILEALFASWLVTANETEGDTAWAALNAVTRYTDHARGTRRTSSQVSEADARMASAFYGSGAVLKSQAVRRLAEHAGIDMRAASKAAHAGDLLAA